MVVGCRWLVWDTRSLTIMYGHNLGVLLGYSIYGLNRSKMFIPLFVYLTNVMDGLRVLFRVMDGPKLRVGRS